MSELTTLQMRNLKVMLTIHEGDKSRMYFDKVGKKWTVGIGRNMTDRDLYPSERDLMFSNDVNDFHTKLQNKFPWFDQLNDARKMALIDMCFMGFKNFCEFDDMIKAFEVSDFETAAKEILDSKYRHEVGQRAYDIAEIIKTGSLNNFYERRNIHGLYQQTA